MSSEDIIKKCLLGKDSRVKFKNDNKFYYVKNISNDREHVFVTNEHNDIFRKKIKNIVNCGNTILNESNEIIKKLLRESARNLNISFKTYEQAKEILGDNNKIKLDRVVYLHKVDKNICVKYYDTNVVCFDFLGNKTLRNGGWQTVTTQQIINQFLSYGVHIFQKKGEWYVKGKNGTYSFYDGIQITNNGDVLSKYEL